jgi:CNT family concentrative nucleoside transporter
MQVSNHIFQALVGFIFLVGIAFCFSENKKKINWKLIVVAFILQNILFLLISYVTIFHSVINVISSTIINLLGYANQGAEFVFGSLTSIKKNGFIFGLVVVPSIIFFGGLVGVLYFWGLIQWLITNLARVLRKVIKLSAVESLVIVADAFLGQAEAPLLIGPYISMMTRSELACAFTAGLANISGTTLGMYLAFLGGNDPIQVHQFANYLVTASFMNIFSAVIFAKVIFPENVAVHDYSHENVKINTNQPKNLLDGLFEGSMKGLKIGVTIVMALIVAIAVVHMLDGILAWFGNIIHLNHIIATATNGVFPSLSIEYILGQIFRVFAFFMGIGWSETLNVGSLLGQKVAINEFVAYMSLGHMKAIHALSTSAIFISTFALASFSNLSSIGISLGSYSVLAPNRVEELSGMAFKCLFGAVLAGFMTATVAGCWHYLLG